MLLHTNPRGRHRLARGSDRAFDAAHQPFERASQGPQEGPSFPSRPSEDGRSAPRHAQLSQKEGHRALPRPDRGAWSA